MPEAATLVMGILNITPDSFYDGGRYVDPASAAAAAMHMAADGADWIDIGAESSRPGSEPVGGVEEWRRLAPVLESLQGSGLNISVDTYRAETARYAIALGATMINDISAFRMDPELAEVVADAQCHYVLMHMLGEPSTMQQNPRYNDVVDDICRFFEERLAYAARMGLREERIWLDPGFGFGKTPGHNLELLRRLGEFRRFGLPLLIGTSNKGTIGQVLDVPPDQRLEGTAATVAIGIWNGASAVRVHDVKAMSRVARMTDAIAGRRRY